MTPIAPAEGERRALSGYLPQFKVAAEKVRAELVSRRLEAVVLADPEAGTLDDVQIVSRQPDAPSRLDAYQIKWVAGTLAAGEFKELLVEMVDGRRRIVAARAKAGKAPLARLIAHLYTNRSASPAPLQGEGLTGRGLTLARFLGEVWRPAAGGAFDSLEAVPEDWRYYLEILGKASGLEALELLQLAPQVRFDLEQRLPEDKAEPGLEGERFCRDVAELAAALKELVVDANQPEELSAEQLLSALGPDWLARTRPRSEHEFPVRDHVPIEASISELRGTLEELEGGYLFLFGSPGSGKSTLLTEALRNDERLVARYYAYVPGSNTPTRGEAEAFLHDLLLAIRGKGSLLPPPSDVALLREQLREELTELGERFTESGTRSLILIDGLDHVEREPRPQVSLLNELPPPEEVPPGVLIVLGTRSAGDLPGHLAPAARDAERVLEAKPLPRSAVVELSERAEVGEMATAIFTAAGGHPLLTRTLIELVKELAPDQREVALAELPILDGEVMRYYETVWADMADDTELLVQLGLISRLRCPLDLDWLRATGSPAPAVERLERLGYLFERRGSRWAFFHDSFREFLRCRSGERGGQQSPEKERGIHAELATRCATSMADRPEAWEQIHHLLGAGEYAAALAMASPPHFRAQLDVGRPPGEVSEDIRAAAGALAERQDGLGVVQLALSAAEVDSRGFAMPGGINFAELLLLLGNPELAVAQLPEISEVLGGPDRSETAMSLALSLWDAKEDREAERVFELYEPLQWFGGGGERQAVNGPWQTLYRWSAAAVVLRGAEHVIGAVGRLSVKEEDRGEDPALRARRMRVFEANLLATAATEALRRGQTEDYERLLAAIEEHGGSAGALADCLLAELRGEEGCDRHEQLLARLAGLADQLSGGRKLRLARVFLESGRREEAVWLWITARRPGVPEEIGLREDRGGWEVLYAYHRLGAALGRTEDPARAIAVPAQGSRRQPAFFARHLVAQANLHGRLWASEAIGAGELLRGIERLEAFWEAASGHDRLDLHGAGPAKRIMLETAVAVATEIGPEAVAELWGHWKERWISAPVKILADGLGLIRRFSVAAVGDSEVRWALARFGEQRLREESEPSDWVELGLAWLGIGDRGQAAAMRDRALAATLGVGFRKDYQLSEWLRLIEPLLGSEAGEEATLWLADAIVGLAARIESGGANDAGGLLVRGAASRNPRLALEAGRRLRAGGVLELDEMLSELLRASSGAGELWWIVLGEILVALGADPPAEIFAGVRSDDAEHLREIARRVSVEGRPTARRTWRQELLAVAARNGLDGADLEIEEADLEIGDETPIERSSGSEDDRREREADPIGDLLARLEEKPDEYTVASVTIGRIGEMEEAEVERVAELLAGTEREAALAASIATVALASGERERAWRAAERSLAIGSARDWTRHWAGGPVLEAIAVLRELDAPRARDLVFRRFSSLAAADSYLLGELARDLHSYIDAFAPIEGLASAVWDYVTALLAANAPADAPKVEWSKVDERELDPKELDLALGELIGELLGSPYTLGWSTAQRALLAWTAISADATMLCELFDGEVDRARLLALTESLVGGDFRCPPELIERLLAVADEERLDVRASARELLEKIGVEPPAPQRRPLPKALELEIAPSGAPAHLRARSERLGQRKDLVEMVALHGEEITELARLGDLDRRLLFERVVALAEREPDAAEGDASLGRREGPLGWGYIKPSAVVTQRILAKTCAELFDAGRVKPYEALYACRLLPMYEPVLLGVRPQGRPAGLPPSVPFDRRDFHFGDWLADLASAEERLATELNDWTVVGERSQIALLGRQMPEEEREQAMTTGEVDRIFDAHLALSAADYGREPPTFEGNAVILQTRVPSASPDEWMALHPAISAEFGLERDPAGLFAWRLDGELVARSVWWRSGYRRWAPYSPVDEVGEGWLVLARAALIAKMGERYGADALRTAWRVRTAMRDESSSEREERERSGIRPLVAA